MDNVNNNRMAIFNVNVHNVRTILLIKKLSVEIMEWLIRKWGEFLISSIFFELIRSKCFLEHDACTRQIDIKARHLGECNNCQDIVCLFHGRCQLEQGTYKCTCPTRDQCQTSRVSWEWIWWSNLHLLFRQIIYIQSVEVIKNYSIVNVRWMYVHVNYKLIFMLLHLIIVQNKPKKLVKSSIKEVICWCLFLRI